MQQTRSLPPLSPSFSAARQSAMSRSSASSAETIILNEEEDDESSLLSGLRQHPISTIAESEAASVPASLPAAPSSNTSVVAGRDSLRPFPATRGFVAGRDSLRSSSGTRGVMVGRESLRPFPSTRGFVALRDSRTSGQTWTIHEAVATRRSDQFEYDSPDLAATRRSGFSSGVDSSSFHRTSQGTSVFYGAGLSPPPQAPGEDPFQDQPQVPGMVYMPTRLTAFQQQVPRVVQPFPFAQAESARISQGGPSEGERSTMAASQQGGHESSGESLVEVTDIPKIEPPLPTPVSQFSRPTSVESAGGTTSVSSSDYDAGETLGPVMTAGFGVSAISGKP